MAKCWEQRIRTKIIKSTPPIIRGVDNAFTFIMQSIVSYQIGHNGAHAVNLVDQNHDQKVLGGPHIFLEFNYTKS